MEAEEKHTIKHISHQHPLESTVAAPPTANITCSGCDLKILSGKDYYECKTCSFSLHRICSNMPRKTRHPAHPNHHLTLLVSPPNSNLNSNCKACGHNLSGFCYSCSECSVYYHILCSALPLSLAISSHPHTLRIEFSPPYDFSCDLCHQPSHSGWLYRCRFCEFDAHISCAFAQHRAQPVPLPNTLTRQIVYSVTLMEVNRMIDYGIESNELMQLVQQGLADSISTLAAGSPKESINGGNNIGHLQVTSNRPRNQDEEQSVPSYQCSSCFSIELLKSYECQDLTLSPENEEAPIGNVSEVETKIKHGEKQENRAVFNPLYMAQENWVNEESFNGYDHGRKSGRSYGGGDSKAIGFDAYPGSKDHTILRSKSASSRWSGRWKVLGCFDSIRNQNCSKSFKNL